MTRALRRFLSDDEGRIVVIQWPNAPLIAWALFAVAAWRLQGAWSNYFDFLSGVALVTWSYLEITRGDSPFRRVLGAVVMLSLLVARMP